MRLPAFGERPKASIRLRSSGQACCSRPSGTIAVNIGLRSRFSRRNRAALDGNNTSVRARATLMSHYGVVTLITQKCYLLVSAYSILADLRSPFDRFLLPNGVRMSNLIIL